MGDLIPLRPDATTQADEPEDSVPAGERAPATSGRSPELVQDTHYEVALDDETVRHGQGTVLVDPPAREGARRPIVAPQWRGPDNIKATVRRIIGRWAYQ